MNRLTFILLLSIVGSYSSALANTYVSMSYGMHPVCGENVNAPGPPPRYEAPEPHGVAGMFHPPTMGPKNFPYNACRSMLIGAAFGVSLKPTKQERLMNDFFVVLNRGNIFGNELENMEPGEPNCSPPVPMANAAPPLPKIAPLTLRTSASGIHSGIREVALQARKELKKSEQRQSQSPPPQQLSWVTTAVRIPCAPEAYRQFANQYRDREDVKAFLRFENALLRLDIDDEASAEKLIEVTSAIRVAGKLSFDEIAELLEE